MCEVGINKGCKNCPYLYNEEFCLMEDTYIDNNREVIEMEIENETIKINRVHKRP